MPEQNFEKIEDSYVIIDNCRHFLRKYLVNDSDKVEIVFLHDGLGCVESFGTFPMQMCKALGKNGVAYDRIGHGKSAPPFEQQSLDYLEKEAFEILPQIIRLLNMHKPLIVGASDGATIALLYVSRDISIGILSISAHAYVEELTIHGINNTFQKLSHGILADRLREMHGEKATKLMVSWASTWLSEEFRSWNILHKLESIDCPVLLLQGNDDPYATKHHCKSIADAIGENAQFVFIDDGGHLPHHKKPDYVIESFVEFLGL